MALSSASAVHGGTSSTPIDVDVAAHARATIVADVRLTQRPRPADLAVVAELVRAVESWQGPGILVFNGNTFAVEARATEPEPGRGVADPAGKPTGRGGRHGGGDHGPARAIGAALDAHRRLEQVVRAFAAGPDRRVMLLPGRLDSWVASSDEARRVLATRLGAEVVEAVDLSVHTGAGARRVRIEPGPPVGPDQAPADRRAGVLTGGSAWLPRRWGRDAEHLADRRARGRFFASRLLYRTLGRAIWLLAAPLVAVLALDTPRIPGAPAVRLASSLPTRLTTLLATALVEVLVVSAAAALIRAGWRRLAGQASPEEAVSRDPNRPGRDRARELIVAGYAGMVTNWTCRAELAHLGTGFHANPGPCGEVVTETPTRLPSLGLPPVFLTVRQLAWVEIAGGHDLDVRLFHAGRVAGGATLVERLLGLRPPGIDREAALHPELVASYPHGRTWPLQPSGAIRQRRIRRLSAGLVAISAFVTLVSTLSEPLGDRLRHLRDVLPLQIPESAAALTALAGIGLLVLARGVRRGQRRAWAAALALLLASVFLHLVKGVDYEEAALAAAVATFLWVNRECFEAKTDVPPLRGALSMWVGVAAATVLAGTLGIELGVQVRNQAALTHHHLVPTHLGWAHALQATAERMVGIERIALPHRINEFVSPALATVGVGLCVALLVLLFRPVVARRRAGRFHASDLARARAIVARHGAGSLDYFALREDKQFFFWGDTVVAYGVRGGVCLVSPDPIGPAPEREPAWRAFRAFADDHGWALGGLGADRAWLPIYQSTGMHQLYVGDEGVVRTDRFELSGGQFKGLRQAVNRVARYGYQVSFHDPAHLDPQLRDGLEAMMTGGRRGDAERGFSMTLGRAFDPADEGLLLAVVHAPVRQETANGADGDLGPPVAFCQYTPAPGIGGYSLDLMRRDRGDHPNGLIDYAIVATIRHLRERGVTALSLNFATLRAMLAGETGDGGSKRAQAWMLRRLTASMQVESLWRFNAKFDPEWHPRYAIFDAPENAVAIAVAIARAESWWEIPLVGRLLRRPGPRVELGRPAEPGAPEVRPALVERLVTAARRLPGAAVVLHALVAVRGSGRAGATVRLARTAVVRWPVAAVAAARASRVGRALRGWPGAAAVALAAVGLWALVRAGALDRTPIDRGWLLEATVTAAVVGMVVGVARRGRRWWETWGVGTALVAAGIVAFAAWWIKASGLVPEHYPPSFLAWTWGAVWAASLALTGWWSGGAAVRVVRAITAPVAVLAAFCLINTQYGYWPTVGALLGRPAIGQVSAAVVRRDAHTPRVYTTAMPKVGQYGPVSIPGTGVGFDAARAYVWLPPDFTRVPHEHMPVLLMLPGWPGDVSDWVRAGQVLAVANRWALDHHGAAPMMVFVDENGAHGRDTECVNGPQGDAATYLTRTVPDYLHRAFGLRHDAQRWAVVGFSEGGTCAVGLGSERPDVFGRFADLAGDLAPNWGVTRSPRVALLRLYGGNEAAARAYTPMTVLATHHYDQSDAWFSAGTSDRQHVAIASELAAASTDAGIQTHTLFVQGKHNWRYAGRAFADIYPSLVQSLGEPPQEPAPHPAPLPPTWRPVFVPGLGSQGPTPARLHGRTT